MMNKLTYLSCDFAIECRFTQTWRRCKCRLMLLCGDFSALEIDASYFQIRANWTKQEMKLFIICM